MIQDDSVGGFKEHKDSVYCVSFYNHEPFNLFVSGDGNDKALIWRLQKEEPKPEQEEEKE